MIKALSLCLLLTFPGAAFAGDGTDAAAAAATAPAATTSQTTTPAAKTPKRSSAPAGALKTDEQKTLYALGFYLGTKLAPFSLSAAELKTVQSGIGDSVLNKPAQVDVNEFGPKINDLAQQRQAKFAAKEEAAAKKEAEPRKAKEKAFLEAQAKEKGAQVSKSGLIYFDVKVGTGAHPTADDTVKCHYEGKLVDGTVFDSSYKRGEPADFPLRGVVPCWTEGIQKMKVGGKAKLICPSDIAYGDMGRPPVIPAGATLIFEVELLDIKK